VKTVFENTLRHRLGELPIIAILRGIKPGESVAVGEALVRAGIRIIEVPLNSPEPFRSIEKLTAALGDRALIGAGTVLRAADVAPVMAVGGRIIVAPDSSPNVIDQALKKGLDILPGFRTPTEAFAAIRHGAFALKYFPCTDFSLAELKQTMAVIPADISIIGVGGVDPSSVSKMRRIGIKGVGVGSWLYSPGSTAEQVYEKAKRIINAWNESACSPP
jgi:2-dehydro-3-deoxyphosphogalactonate aldolase